MAITPTTKKVYNKSERGKAAQARYRATHRQRHLMNLYGLSVSQYDEMLKRQNGVCFFCGKGPKKNRLAVEHDHKSKRVRGLVCWYCNYYIVGKNTLETARKLVAYLESDFDGRTL